MNADVVNAKDRHAFCAFCGLPLPSGFQLGSHSTEQQQDYCCTGCRSVATVEQAQGEQGKAAQGLLRLGLAVFLTMNTMVFTMALWSGDLYPEESFADPLATSLRSVFRWATLVFAMPVLWLLGGPIIQGVRQSLRRRSITTDLLILGGVSAAYGYSIVSVLRGEGHVYFEVGSMVLVFVSIGRWLEAKGKLRTNESLDRLASLLPETVRRLDANGSFQETPREQITSGDVLRVLAGERIPVDGIIQTGVAEVDEQMISGESRFSAKTVGDQVFGGTLNIDGDLRIAVTSEDGKETLTRLIELVRSARSTKGSHERLADRIATWFVPAVFVIALLAGWWQGTLNGLDQGILTGLAVALIACPCALGLATPMAVWTALGRAAEHGVLFRSGLVMEKLARIRYVYFDKTGTLTENQPEATHLIVADPLQRERILEVAGAVTSGSRHQLSQAIAQFAEHRIAGGAPHEAALVSTLPGKGLISNLPDLGDVVLGSRRLLTESQLHLPASLDEQAAERSDSQLVFLGWGGEVKGAFCFEEQVRPEAAEALAACRQLGLPVELLTGDAEVRATTIGRALALPASGGLLPEEKFAAIRARSTEGPVAMIGDGLNDAPALAAADVGVALGCGADVSRDAAGVCLLANDLRRFPWAVELARTTSRIVTQNLFWAFLYNVFGIALAATGRLNPIWAALAMAVSSLLVVANSLRLSRFPLELSLAEGSTAAESHSPLLVSNIQPTGDQSTGAPELEPTAVAS
ncbi:heavy metal translocating P-type ATPase [Adhaeretor mobilis]|uniref:Putative copper-exporting P-type ATPase V n=1 Tax=Adhaeretor mobilis TaxID=1930276 RepID=A0A517MV71_9BACT|nr:heavy metal translocating P-type ATPase [Adhaeretor mobilis]QDS98783.1 putative copper-exporting P-type ATPase V [Adhaeretor mobilis]